MTDDPMKLLEEMAEANRAVWSASPEGRAYLSRIDRCLASQPVSEIKPVAVVDANDDGYWADILPDNSVKVGDYLYDSAALEAARREGEIAGMQEDVVRCHAIGEATKDSNRSAGAHDCKHAIQLAIQEKSK